METTIRKITLLFLLSLIPVANAADLGYKTWGVRGGLSIDPDQIHVGAHVNLGEITENLRLRPNVEIGFGDRIFLFMLNGETFYLFNVPDDETRLYAGGELSIVYWNVDAPGKKADDIEIGLSEEVESKSPFRTTMMASLKLNRVWESCPISA